MNINELNKTIRANVVSCLTVKVNARFEERFCWIWKGRCTSFKNFYSKCSCDSAYMLIGLTIVTVYLLPTW